MELFLHLIGETTLFAYKRFSSLILRAGKQGKDKMRQEERVYLEPGIEQGFGTWGASCDKNPHKTFILVVLSVYSWGTHSHDFTKMPKCDTTIDCNRICNSAKMEMT